MREHQRSLIPRLILEQASVGIVSSMEKDASKKQGLRTIATALLSLEAVLVLALGGFLIVKSFTSAVEAPSALIGEVLFALAGGFGLLAAAHGFRRNRNYGRAPAVLANLIALGIAYFQMDARLWIIAIPLALLASVTLVVALLIIPE